MQKPSKCGKFGIRYYANCVARRNLKIKCAQNAENFPLHHPLLKDLWIYYILTKLEGSNCLLNKQKKNDSFNCNLKNTQ
mgnify:CR=1 FL=1